ncbi:MAG: TrkA family potassium uptake protein [Spirochaetes bacterium]|jgi:trk system potassium uptake protein TrkA|nr:TrkA family potassium uptake protein [Spirochaetota bacterium]
MQRCIVIGLGNFGYTTALTLYQAGIDVIAVDSQKDIVSYYKDELGVTICCDASNKEQLESLQINNFDAAVVAIGQNMTASILITMHLQDLKIKRLITRAISTDHAKILEKIGVDEIIYPEQDTAIKTANKLMMKNITDYLHISDEYSIIEIPAPEEFFNKKLAELAIPKTYNCQVIGIKYRSIAPDDQKDEKEFIIEQTIIAPNANDIIRKNCLIIVLGKTEDISRLQT